MIRRRALPAGALAALAILAAGIASAQTRLADLPYGDHPRQVFDLYLPPGDGDGRPIIVMLHGGGWDRGGKGGPGAWRSLLEGWTPEGYILAAPNTRLGPEADPRDQAADLSAAIAEIQSRAPDWGGDPGRTILIGHSSGGHVAALMAADPDLSPPHPVRGTVVLDSGYLDVVGFMARLRPAVFLRAFGFDPARWPALSPAERLGPGAAPFLLVCGTRIPPTCIDNEVFALRATELGVETRVLPVDLSHGDILATLGRPSDYTDTIRAWIEARLAP